MEKQQNRTRTRSAAVARKADRTAWQHASFTSAMLLHGGLYQRMSSVCLSDHLSGMTLMHCEVGQPGSLLHD